MHNGFVTIGEDNEKMSKSLGNFVTVHDLLKRVDGQVIRLLMSTTHYRRPIQYSQASVQEASSNLKKLQTGFNNLTYRLHNAEAGSDPKVEQEVRQIIADFTDAMDDDFNVQNGIAAVYELVKFANMYSERDIVFQNSLQFIINTLTELSSIFGIKLEQSELKDEEIWDLIHERERARACLLYTSPSPRDTR